MSIFSACFFLLQQDFSVSAAPLSNLDSPGSLMLTEPSANSIRFNSTRPEQITSLTEVTVFPIKGTTLNLTITVNRAVYLNRKALRDALYDAWTTASNVIDVSGDGDLPASCVPYKVVKDHTYIRLDGNVQAHRKLRWSDVREIMWGLRTFMVVQGRSFRLAFSIFEEGHAHTLGYGRVLQGIPLYPTLTKTFNSSEILNLAS